MTIIFIIFGISMIAIILYGIFTGTKPWEMADVHDDAITKIFNKKSHEEKS